MELKIQNITKRYRDKTAVDDVSITLTPGVWAVSYTHLDVYKRQLVGRRGTLLRLHRPQWPQHMEAAAGGEHPQKGHQDRLERQLLSLIHIS